MFNPNTNPPFSVSKIAIVNPYLQGGHVLIAESETTARFIQAGKNLSIDIQAFASVEEVEDFDPDFVINITYQEGKLTKYPTYVSLNIPIYFLKDVPRFIRNILTCDGFLTVSPSVVNWLKQLCIENNKQMYVSHTAFSVPKTEFVTCDFKNATAMYIGTNWDGLRHQNIFHLLSKGDYLKCFGPAKSWSNYPATLYGGEIPFDGISTFREYRKNAIGLCIGHPEFDNAGIANTRIFEIAAASALPICAYNELTKHIYGDSVLYLDSNVSAENLANQISVSVQWVRNHPKIAEEMARQAHECFNKNASMEFYIKNLIEMHEQAMIGNGFKNRDCPKNISEPISEHRDISSVAMTQVELPQVTYILTMKYLSSKSAAIIKDIFSQTYPDINIILIAKNNLTDISELVDGSSFDNTKIHSISYEGIHSNLQILNCLNSTRTEWIGILSDSDRIFPNHTLSMIKTYHARTNKKGNVSGIFSGCLECSETVSLPELMIDDHHIVTHNKVRIRYTKCDVNVPLGSLLLHIDVFNSALLKKINFYMAKTDDFYRRLIKNGDILETYAITSAVYIDKKEALESIQCLTEKSINAQLLLQFLALQQRISAKEEIKETPSRYSWKAPVLFKKVMRFYRLLKE